MMSFTRARRAWPLLALSLLSVAALAQNELRDNLFAQTDDALKAANEARANILAPKNYGDAAEHYRSAEDRLRIVSPGGHRRWARVAIRGARHAAHASRHATRVKGSSPRREGAEFP